MSRNDRELQFETGKLRQNHRQVPQTKERNVLEKEELGRDCFEQKSIGEKQEFRVMMARWLSCRGSGLLVGDAVRIFPCWDL